MKSNTAYQTKIEHQFDSYCKAVLRNGARNIYKERRRREQRLVPLSALTPAQLSQLSELDEYASDYIIVPVTGFDGVPIKDVLVAEAISSLSKKRQDIVLLSYFFEMSNKDIGSAMNLSESTVHYHKQQALQQLKTYLEEHADETN